MASLTKSKNGSYRILVVCADGKRRSVRLEKGTTKKTAETIKTNIEHLNASIASQDPLDLAVAKWLGTIKEKSPKLHERIVRVGLTTAAPVERKITLGEYLDGYFGARTGMKPATQTVYSHIWKRLEEFFKRSTKLEDITPTRAREFKVWLEVKSNKRDKPTKEEGKKATPKPLAMNTVRRRIGFCRQIFAQAVQDGVIARNPFAGRDMQTTVRSNKDRQFYVPLDVFEKVLEKAPNARWRALLVLARIGAFRIPSEAKGLKWEHIAWDARRISVVMSSKTEHHAKRQVRVVPLHPSIERELLKLHAEAEEGAVHVFPDIDGDTNLRTTLLKIIARAGVEPWPKLFQNLRASGATDFARTLPSHVAASICGHTEQIALEHYRMATEYDIEQALQSFPENVGALDVRDESDDAQKVTQNAAQQTTSNQGQSELTDDAKLRETQRFFEFLLSELMDDTGLEPVTPAV